MLPGHISINLNLINLNLLLPTHCFPLLRREIKNTTVAVIQNVINDLLDIFGLCLLEFLKEFYIVTYTLFLKKSIPSILPK